MWLKRSLVLLVIAAGVALVPGWSAAAEPVPVTVSATVGPDGTTLSVTAPGCQPTPPGEFEIFVQSVSPTGEVGEGAVGAGTFTAPDQGSVLIPAGTPGVSFLLTVSCNAGALTGSLAFVLAAPMPSPPITAPARFTG